MLRGIFETVYDRLQGRYDDYNDWASSRFHMHFYPWAVVQDNLDIDMVPIPMPMWFNVPGRERYVEFWRFSFDS